MDTTTDQSSTDAAHRLEGSTMTTAAQRALAEAAERKARQEDARTRAEVGGRGGLDPVRYGDWEVRGLTSDF